MENTSIKGLTEDHGSQCYNSTGMNIKRYRLDIRVIKFTNRGFTRVRYALRLLPAMAFSDLQKTQLPSLSMAAAFVVNR